VITQVLGSSNLQNEKSLKSMNTVTTTFFQKRFEHTYPPIHLSSVLHMLHANFIVEPIDPIEVNPMPLACQMSHINFWMFSKNHGSNFHCGFWYATKKQTKLI
jgi:hypothetical protein